jgi:hypothetical protein
VALAGHISLAKVAALRDTGVVRKWCKFFVALLLLPLCLGAALALGRVIQASGNADTIWVATLSGAACWVVIYLLLPKPMWVYVFGHELTHAVWTWALGGRVKRFKASAQGGHVVVTKTHFLIALAPYFFPLYAVLVVVVFWVGHWFWNWQPYVPGFHLLLGAAYAFHVTLTWHILQSHQSDIAEQGYLFSAVIIFLGNVGVLLLGIPLLTARVDLRTAMSWWLAATAESLQALAHALNLRL